MWSPAGKLHIIYGSTKKHFKSPNWALTHGKLKRSADSIMQLRFRPILFVKIVPGGNRQILITAAQMP